MTSPDPTFAVTCATQGLGPTRPAPSETASSATFACGPVQAPGSGDISVSSGTDCFARAFAVVLGHEGGYTADPADPGNWTGGAPGRGECRGTKWGISAASYPNLPIRELTPDQARAIYRRDYWDRVGGDRLPPSLAVLVFDAAVNCGVGRAARWLQGVLGVVQDGAVGEITLAALTRHIEAGRDAFALCAEFQAARLLYMASLPTWQHFGGGWAKRLCRLPFDALRMETV